MILSSEQRLEILKLEMQLLQGTFEKYDDLIFRNRNWFITLWMGTMGLSFTLGSPILALFTAFLAVLYWFLEGLMRHQYWYKYVVRYRTIRDELHREPPNVEGLSLYDLTNHWMSNKQDGCERLRKSFFKLEPTLLYISLGVGGFVIWRLMLSGVIKLDS